MSKKRRFLFICTCFGFLLGSTHGLAQSSSAPPYQLDGWKDGTWTGLGLAGSAYGLILISNKKGISDDALARIGSNQSKLNSLDRWVAGKDSETANSRSDIPFYTSFALPFLMLFDDQVNDHTGQILALYLESLATTGAMYSITAGLVNRSRPYVYSEDQSLDRRKRNNGQRSFYSGHVAGSATATFFAAKVFLDLNPDTKGKGWIWAGASLVPMAVGYFRIQAGQHFLTDTVLGFALGAATGILIPTWHKKPHGKLTLRTSTSRAFGVNHHSICMGIRL